MGLENQWYERHLENWHDGMDKVIESELQSATVEMWFDYMLESLSEQLGSVEEADKVMEVMPDHVAFELFLQWLKDSKMNLKFPKNRITFG